mmetsp:Transcript_97990/g.238412  ORF Transcript_97990/g.238412 Transcript_97990/m.238412 type:complete len:127 (+) Transcript_97990:92-472(+)
MASSGMAAVFKQGAWTSGLFDIECPDCLKHCCCGPCALAAIHKDNGSPFGNDQLMCLAAFCGTGGCQLAYYGMKKKGPLEPLPVAVLKAWCCGGCYLHQQYKEITGGGNVIDIAKNMGKPAQEEMS